MWVQRINFLSSLRVVIAFVLEGLQQLNWKIFVAERVDKEWKTGRKENGRKRKLNKTEIRPKSAE